MPYGIIKVNKAKCLYCGDIVISNETQKTSTCMCGKLTVYGGKSYLGRTGKKGKDYKELSVLDFSQLPDDIAE